MRFLGGARVPRVGFGVAPKHAFQLCIIKTIDPPFSESPRQRDVFANTRGACATQS
jgi:hypothetical protein